MPPTTAEERRAIVEAALEVDRTDAAHKAALERFDALVEGRRIAGATKPAEKRKGKGKIPDPQSINQRVLKAITDSPAPVAIESLAIVLGVDAKKIRHAIAYHQKKGRIVHAGMGGQYTVKGRMDLNGASAEH